MVAGNERANKLSRAFFSRIYQYFWEGSSELLNGNPESLFMSWLNEHGGAVLKVARAYTLTTEDCQDLVQEILLQVWRSLPQFQGRASVSTWFYRSKSSFRFWRSLAKPPGKSDRAAGGRLSPYQ
jgi:hypothetical protein